MPPRIFLSYAQVPEDHKQRVAELAASLEAAGLDVVFDGDVTSPQGPPEGWPKWMLDQIESADWVLVICNEAYYKRFRGKEVPGLGLGARWEGAIIGQALYSDGTVNRKFVPVLLGDDQAAHIPEPLRGATWYRLPAELPKLATALREGSVSAPPASAKRPSTFAHGRLPRFSMLSWGGLLGALLLIALLLWKTRLGDSPSSTQPFNFPLTVYVHGEAGAQELILRNQGAVLLDLGTDRRREKIGDKGQAYFPEIPASFQGQNVRVGLDAESYELIDPRPRKLAGTSLYLSVRRKPGHITGRVQDEAGNPVAGASVNVAGFSDLTNPAGHFDITIPGDRLQPELPLQITAQGYTSWHSSVVPGSNEVVVPLSRP